jgi:IS30 family transposase
VAIGALSGPERGAREVALWEAGERRRVMAQFSGRMVPEVVQVFWAAMARGEFVTAAAAEAGTYREMGTRWLAASGGVRPRRGRDLKGRCLTFSEREAIAVARAGGESMRSIARRLRRSPSTVSRELARNGDRAGGYRATTAHARAYVRASRPKPSKLAVNGRLRRQVEEDLRRRYSPEQIVGRLHRQFPDDPEMRVSAETIYQSLYVQSRGALRRDLTRCLRTGRALRRPRRRPGQRRNQIPDMINIAERPAEADDRAVPGHWEGDLILGKNNLSAIGTLVERTTGYTMLVHLPDGYKAEQVRDALTQKIQTIPEILRASLTWDQGIEMRDWQQVSVAADIDIYFCDPHSPWQRATNENTNGLLRQYFPKGTDLSVHSAMDLDWVATELNDRPRKRLSFAKPIEEIGPLLLR